jgi:hypothetical protein
METLSAVRLTAGAARRLRMSRGSGRVHSAYARTVNVTLDDHDEAGWVSLHGPGPIPSPFGIACEAWPATDGLAGASARVEADTVLLDGRLRVLLTGAAVSDMTLPASAPLPSLSGCLARALPWVTGGLLPTVAALLSERTPLPDPLARMAAPALARLYAATSVHDVTDCLTAARSLLGLGPGLTPAGDDCLVGWLAGAWTTGPAGQRLVEAVGTGLLDEAAHRTGSLSRAFLAAALLGEAAEPISAFAALPDAERLEGLLALGATSGADLLGGYLLARQALAGSKSGVPW